MGDTSRTVSIIGAGHAGRALGRLLVRAGWTMGGVACRTLDRAREAVAFIGGGKPESDPVRAVEGTGIVLIAVPDAAIAEVAGRMVPASGAIVAHTCGAQSADVLAWVRRYGAHAGAIHPLRSFADPSLAVERFPGTWCAVEGDPHAVLELEGLVRAIGGRPMRVAPGGKALYHAGAVFASNYIVAALEAAIRLFEAAGIDRGRAREPILNLAEGTLENATRVGIPEALTGPIERGDVETIRAHVAGLRERCPELLEAYGALAHLTCEAAIRKGTLDRAGADRIRGAFTS